MYGEFFGFFNSLVLIFIILYHTLVGLPFSKGVLLDKAAVEPAGFKILALYTSNYSRRIDPVKSGNAARVDKTVIHEE